MTNMIVLNEKTGAEEVVSRCIVVPIYDIGHKVIFKDKTGFKVEGVVTGITLTTCADKDRKDTSSQIYYTIDDGVDEIFEEEIVEYYVDKIFTVAS